MESVKTKVLTFSKDRRTKDKVVHRYYDLYPYNEHVFFYADIYDSQSYDYGTFGLVLKVGHTYFYFTTVGLENLLIRKQMNIVTNLAENFFEEIEQIMSKGECIPNLWVEVCKQEGRDISRLQTYCERYKHNKADRK